MKKISWGIIGCGNVTEVKSGPAFNLVPNSELVAVMRRDAGKAEDYAMRHGVKKWFADAGDLINDSDVNALYIATPPAFHEAYTLQAFKAGKQVYVEKPMALDSAEAERMAQAAEHYQCKLSIAHYRRAQPRFKKILKLLNDKTIGEILAVELHFHSPYQPGTENTWRINPAISGGGLFHDLAPHQLDLMVYFFGRPLKVEGSSLNRANLYDADDYAQAKIIFENNIKFHGIWDFNAPFGSEEDLCVINGSHGSISFEVFGNDCDLTIGEKTEKLEFDYLPHVQQPMIDQVVKYFIDEGSNPCPAEEAVAVMTMMDKITGKTA
ncbi:Gfo/Idh/MocA family protein [Daejeonella lutea]|uniref:Predicted dehydrogenase n=1 Tax=Daejeonella lutea TaxID=572036 RepID=A0A1T5EZ44_9SPHI|nr:Gfo/Idh/MocA family oxidoreductase [Daejeonella lutea]SKB89197.1 Predicted dehydrogenase [Daejeonella lutea]